MRREQLSQSEQGDDEYLKQEKDITTLIDKYRDKRKPNIYKQIDNAFFNYEQLLETNYASPAKWAWLSDRKAQVNALRNQKATENQEVAARNFVTVAHIDALGQKNRTALNGIEKNIEEAISISTYIKAELQKQIQDLDRVYETNKDMNARIKRSMDGLRTMLRRIMMSKLTRCLSIITVLVIIGLIVVYFLKNNGNI